MTDEKKVIGRPYRSPEEVLDAIAKDPHVQLLSPVEIRAVEIGGDMACIAQARVSTARPSEKHPTTWELTVSGDDIADAIENLGRALDDWFVMRHLNIPELYRTNPDLIMGEVVGHG